MTTDMREKIEAMLAGLEGVTPGPWDFDTELQAGTSPRYNEFALFSKDGLRLCGTENCDYRFAEIATEYDDDGPYSWNEPARILMEHLARCDPDTIRELCRLAKIGMNAEREPVFDLRAFSRENRARCEAPNGFRHPLSGWSLAEWLNAVTGELGEVAGAIKEMLRARDGVPNKGWSPDVTRQNLSAEIADTAIYLDLLAQAAGLDLASAIRAKFDLTSAKVGYTVGGEHD